MTLDAVLAALLSNSLLAALIGLLARLVAVRLRRPAAGHALFVLALCCLLSPPLYRLQVARLPTPWPTATATPQRSSTPLALATDRPSTYADAVPRPEARLGGAATRPPLHTTSLHGATPAAPQGSPWRTLLLALWATGSLAIAGTSFLRHRRGRRALHLATVGTPAALRDDLRALGDRIGRRRLPRLRVVATRVGPALRTRAGRAEVVFPAHLLADLDAPTRRAVLLHELAHHARGDHLVRLLEALATALLWWHPLPWLLRAGLREAEERACDAWVSVYLPGSRRRYGEALLQLGTATPRLLFSHASPSRLRGWRRRLEDLMTDHPRLRSSRTTRLALTTLALGCLPLGIAQDPEGTGPGSRAEWEARLDAARIAVDFTDAPLAAWTDRLGAALGATVSRSPAAVANDPSTTTLTRLQLDETPLRKVLDVCTTLTDLRWRLTDRGLHFETASEVPRSPRVRLVGAWQSPGQVALRPDLTLLELIASRPLEQFADLGRVKVLRDPTGEAREMAVDVAEMLRSGNTTHNLLLQPNDLIVLPRLPPFPPGLRLADGTEPDPDGGTLRYIEGFGLIQGGQSISLPLTVAQAGQTTFGPTLRQAATRVRSGSTLRFVVYDHARTPGQEQLALLENHQLVNSDGTIFVPYVGPVHVAGLSEPQISALVSQLLDPLFVTTIQVHARIVEAR